MYTVFSKWPYIVLGVGLFLQYIRLSRLKANGILLRTYIQIFKVITVADPGFPVGGANLIGGANSRCGYVSKNLYVKTKESGPLGACTGGAPWIRQCIIK